VTGLEKRGEIWYFTRRINGQRYRESTGFADKKSAERRAVEIEHDIRAGIHGWKSTIPSFAEWWAVYRKTYTPLKSARNRDTQIVAHFLPHFGARRLDEITKSDIVRYLNARRTQMTGNPGHRNRRLVWTQNPQRLREVMAQGSARAKIPSLTPHTLRHTFGTRWLQAGGDIYKLSKILGHSTVAVTEAHYAHLLKEDLVAASQQVKIPVRRGRAGMWYECLGAQGVENATPEPRRRTTNCSAPGWPCPLP
jgi:hypothetical protein